MNAISEHHDSHPGEVLVNIFIQETAIRSVAWMRDGLSTTPQVMGKSLCGSQVVLATLPMCDNGNSLLFRLVLFPIIGVVSSRYSR